MYDQVWLREEDIDALFPGLGLPLPCTAEVDGSSSPASYCHIIDRLGFWNRILWRAGFQLRELTAPGQLSLVRVAHDGGRRQEQHGRDGRLLFHVLLECHRCVVSVELDEVLVEGSGLREARVRVLSALRNNTSLLSLNLVSLFGDYRFIQEDLFADIGSMTQLRELVISATGEAISCLVDLVCSLLHTASLSTLSISGLRFDEMNAKFLSAALRRNGTVTDLSVHSSILNSRNSKGVPSFSRYLKGSTTLSALTLEGTIAEPEDTLTELASVLIPLIVSSTLQKLKLSGFLLHCRCAWLLSRFVAQQGGSLKHLDISGCRWALDGSPKSLDAPTDDGQPSEPTCAWLKPFDETEQVGLSHLSVSVRDLKPDDFKTLFFVATSVESLRTISIDDVALDVLPEFREAVRRVAVSCLEATSVSAFCKTVHLVRSWNHVTTLRLVLSKEAMGDVFMMWSLCCFVNEAAALKELELAGCDRPDLSHCLGVVTINHSLLLDVIFSNASLRTLRLSQIRLGEANLNFLVDAVFSNDTMTELDFMSWDTSENDRLLRLLAADFDMNATLLRFRVSNTSCDEMEDEGRAIINAFLSRNVGFVTCASHYVARFTDANRCMEALASIPRSRALIDKVQELVAVDEADATSLVEALVTMDFP
ncbi:hypothetical protein HPB52_002733 [Rhipicephalus sanguineus]|uniref:Uncharacterized protein n=1 Tax=Rhipicephalus sanguineus TaxID=34632 RepID=A0A9D4PI61_RHISA|nr:hypothetical protein HPB52_002733 [Rhipicephalus sanguineus]